MTVSEIMRFREKTVPLSIIISDDNTFRITTETSIKRLANSIQNVGLITPVILLQKSSKFNIISGFRRIAACRSLGWQNTAARIVDAGMAKLECVKIAITDNSLQRPLNLIEQSRSLDMLSAFFKDDVEMGNEASALGLPDNPSFINKLIKICHLPPSIQNNILSNTISLDMALELARLGEGVGVEFSDLFSHLKLSLNKQREIITLFKEIAIREDMSIMEIFRENWFQGIFINDDLDRIQKTQKIRSYLKERRYPALTETEKEFKEHVSKMKLGAGVKLIPPNNFEDVVYTLCLRFKNLVELKEHQAALDKIIQHPSMKKILR